MLCCLASEAMVESMLSVLLESSKTLNMLSLLSVRWDGFRNGYLKPEFLSKRALQGEAWPGGTVILLNGMAELKTFLLTDGCACLGCPQDVDFDLQRAWNSLLSSCPCSGSLRGIMASSQRCWRSLRAMRATGCQSPNFE